MQIVTQNDPEINQYRTATNKSGTHTYDPRTHHFCGVEKQEAVLAERERCLRHVKAISLNAMWSDSPQAICEEIADLIRSGK
jgi:hypothetical protein